MSPCILYFIYQRQHILIKMNVMKVWQCLTGVTRNIYQIKT